MLERFNYNTLDLIVQAEQDLLLPRDELEHRNGLKIQRGGLSKTEKKTLVAKAARAVAHNESMLNEFKERIVDQAALLDCYKLQSALEESRKKLTDVLEVNGSERPLTEAVQLVETTVKNNEAELAATTIRILENPDHKIWDPKHPNHVQILDFAKRFCFGQTGPPLHSNGQTMKLDDPFHLWLNTFKAQEWSILKSAFRQHASTRALQQWMFKIGLKHIDLGNHSEDWADYIKSNKDRDRLKKPQEPREDVTGNEAKQIFCSYLDACEVLSAIATDKALVEKTIAVLKQVHLFGGELYSHLKATKNFLPLVDGKHQNPSLLFTKLVQGYHDYFVTNVNAANGFDLVGQDCLMEPWHVTLEHCPGWIHELWEKYDLMIGELSCEIVEHYNKLVCKFLEDRTNHHESMENDKDNKYWQTFRYFLVQLQCFPETLYKTKRKRKCGVCTEAGHNKNSSKKCKKHSKHKPLYSVVYGDDVDP